MEAYKNGVTKKEFLTELKKHQAADNFLRGKYWQDHLGKGCAVGCSVESINAIKGTAIDHGSHKECGEALGIPEWLERLQDTIFEGVSEERSKTWPIEFGGAINEGADLEPARVPIICMILESNIISMNACEYDEEANPQVKAAIDQSIAAVAQMIDAQNSGDSEKVEAAARSAESAARSAARAARSAARAARSAARAARSAAESAAWAAAWAARSAARSAAWAARSAESESAYEYYADEIILILKGIK